MILDTNVISEMMRPPALRDQGVAGWLRSQDARALHITVFTIEEIMFGIWLRPEGRKKALLAQAASDTFNIALSGRVLPYRAEDAERCGALAAAALRAGRQPSGNDLKIAAIALNAGLAVATRNIRDFEETGVKLVNPWQARQ